MKWDPSRALAIAAGLVIIALTAAAFWLSYAHLAEVALGHGLEQAPARAWAWPATLDLFIVAGELLMLRAALALATGADKANVVADFFPIVGVKVAVHWHNISP